jgi:hypothetical protein
MHAGPSMHARSSSSSSMYACQQQHACMPAGIEPACSQFTIQGGTLLFFGILYTNFV